MFLFIIISFAIPFYDLMIFIYNPKELKLTRKQYKYAKGPQLGGVVQCKL